MATSFGTAFDVIRIDVPCPHCGKTDLQPLRDVIVSDKIACRICGGQIDVSTEEWRTFLNESADFYKKFWMRVTEG